MSSYIIEGESFFVLNELTKLTKNKKIEINPEPSNQSFSFIKQIDYSVYFDPDKSMIEKLNNNYIICFMDKNLDLRLDYVKKAKSNAEFLCFDPIPSTDPASLLRIFPKLKSNQFLPTKKVSLKYKGAKQNYEWLDLCLINDLYNLKDETVYNELCGSYFDIWAFTEKLWEGDELCLNQVKHINEKNFEDYFNRIRETSKDYIELLQTKSKNFYDHKAKLPNCVINNSFRHDKVKEKLSLLKPNTEINAIYLLEECLKNVRLGSNPKIELINLFLRFKEYVR
jgi:hypothetical protein